MPGDSFDCHGGRRRQWHQVGEARDADKHPTRHKMAPPAENVHGADTCSGGQQP